jgi:hypothetical protein
VVPQAQTLHAFLADAPDATTATASSQGRNGNGKAPLLSSFSSGGGGGGRRRTSSGDSAAAAAAADVEIEDDWDPIRQRPRKKKRTESAPDGEDRHRTDGGTNGGHNAETGDGAAPAVEVDQDGGSVSDTPHPPTRLGLLHLPLNRDVFTLWGHPISLDVHGCVCECVQVCV